MRFRWNTFFTKFRWNTFFTKFHVLEKNRYLKKVKGSSHQYCLDLSDIGDFDPFEQVQLARVLLMDNRRNPLVSVLACAEIKLPKNDNNIHPWLRRLEQVSQTIQNDPQIQELKCRYLKAYFPKFHWTSLLLLLLLSFLHILLPVLAALFPVIVPLFLFSAIPLSIGITFFGAINWSGFCPQFLNKFFNKWVDVIHDQAAKKFQNAILIHTLNPLNNEAELVRFGGAVIPDINSQSYELVLKQIHSKKDGKPSKLKLRLRNAKGEEIGQEASCKSFFSREPELSFNYETGHFRVDLGKKSLFSR